MEARKPLQEDGRQMKKWAMTAKTETEMETLLKVQWQQISFLRPNSSNVVSEQRRACHASVRKYSKIAITSRRWTHFGQGDGKHLYLLHPNSEYILGEKLIEGINALIRSTIWEFWLITIAILILLCREKKKNQNLWIHSGISNKTWRMFYIEILLSTELHDNIITHI